MHRDATAAMPASLVIVAAGLFGLATFAFSIGLTLVNPTTIQWLFYSGDPEIHFLGWHLFRSGPWTNPLGATPLMRWPVGTSVGLTDSIPLLAVALKPLDAILPRNFQYQGAWLLGCFVLQGVFAALLMRTVTPRRELQLLGGCLLVMSPPMLARYLHEALAAHWIILWALWLSFNYRTCVSLGGWLTACCVAAATHPYIALMIGALMLAAHLGAVVDCPSTWRRMSAQCGAISGCVVLILWQCGYFIVEAANLQGEGFGYFSMNVLAPVLPLSMYRPNAGALAPALIGQYEGYAYLGMGGLLLSMTALWAWRRPERRLMPRAEHRRYLPLAVILLALVVLALGPVVAIGATTVFEYDPEWLGPFTLFRASGRLFWPVYYVLFLTVLRVSLSWSGQRAIWLLWTALLLQGWDVGAHYRSLRDMRNAGLIRPLAHEFWTLVPRHYQRIVVYPTRLCTAEHTFDFQPFALLAGYHALAINAGGAARTSSTRVNDYCESLDRDIRDGVIDADSLYVLRSDLSLGFETAGQPRAVCVTIESQHVCVARETLTRWQNEFDLMFLVVPSLQELVTFHQRLDDEYRLGLRRPAHFVSASPSERIMALTRYLWYRRGGCGHEEAAEKVLRSDDTQPRLCGDPRGVQPLPAAADMFAVRRQLETNYARRPTENTWDTHIDPEGEAVWLHQYLSERLAGREPEEAAASVMNRIRSITNGR